MTTPVDSTDCEPQTMPNPGPEEVPLTTLYLQVEYGESPSAVLGLSNTATGAEVRERYRLIALRLHPDKAPNHSVRETHTRLFQKVKTSYDSLLQDLSTESADSTSAPSKQLPETLASLHARNVAFKETLQQGREKATEIKQAIDSKNVAKLAKLQAKEKKLAGIREARVKAHEAQFQKRERRLAMVTSRNARREPDMWEHAVLTGRKDEEKNPDFDDWQKHEDELEQAEAKAQLTQPVPDHLQKNRPTKTAIPASESTLDSSVATKLEIERRWNTALLSGSSSGSVSLQQKEQKESSAAAVALKSFKALANKADAMYRSDLDEHLHSEALVVATLQVEDEIDAKVSKELRMLDNDVRELHLLEDGEFERSASLEAVQWK